MYIFKNYNLDIIKMKTDMYVRQGVILLSREDLSLKLLFFSS